MTITNTWGTAVAGAAGVVGAAPAGAGGAAAGRPADPAQAMVNRTMARAARRGMPPCSRGPRLGANPLHGSFALRGRGALARPRLEDVPAARQPRRGGRGGQDGG